MAPAVAERAFELKDGEVSEAIRTPQGFAFVTVTGRQDSYVPKLDEVKDARARRGDEEEGGRRRASARGAIGAQMKSGDFNAAAKAAGLEVKTTEFIARGAPIGDVGVSPAVDAVAFALPAGGVSDPIVTDNGTVDRQGARAAGSGRRPTSASGKSHAEVGAAQRAAQPLLRLLHEQGARADEGQRQPRADGADRGLESLIERSLIVECKAHAQ